MTLPASDPELPCRPSRTLRQVEYSISRRCHLSKQIRNVTSSGIQSNGFQVSNKSLHDPKPLCLTGTLKARLEAGIKKTFDSLSLILINLTCKLIIMASTIGLQFGIGIFEKAVAFFCKTPITEPWFERAPKQL